MDLRYGQERYKIESEILNRHNYYNGINRFASYIQGAYSFPSLVRLDYENYFVQKAIPEFSQYNEIDSDKITLELLVFFNTFKHFY